MALCCALYYTAVFEDDEHPSLQPLIDWLAYNGFNVVTKPAKESFDQSGRRKLKGNIDVELAVDALEIAPYIDQMFLFSGDGDFRSLVGAVQRRGVRVVVLSSTQTAAQELRRQADEFIDIAGLRDKIGRDPATRHVRPSRSEGRGSREQSLAPAPPPRNRAMIGAGRDEWDDED